MWEFIRLCWRATQVPFCAARVPDEWRGSERASPLPSNSAPLVHLSRIQRRARRQRVCAGGQNGLRRKARKARQRFISLVAKLLANISIWPSCIQRISCRELFGSRPPGRTRRTLRLHVCLQLATAFSSALVLEKRCAPKPQRLGAAPSHNDSADMCPYYPVA